jgi:hypothetical protein
MKQQRRTKAANRKVANSLLAALPGKNYERLLSGLEPVELKFGDVLYESGQKMRHVYFPGNSLVSLLTVVDGRMALEVGMVGREGMVGLPLALGTDIYALMAQVSQTAACNRFHVVVARLARWLLMTRDRVRSGEFRLTHEFLAHMLGVRRVGVTTAARTLQARKLIDYSRGRIRILDDKGLEAAACECYALVNAKGNGANTPGGHAWKLS